MHPKAREIRIKLISDAILVWVESQGVTPDGGRAMRHLIKDNDVKLWKYLEEAKVLIPGMNYFWYKQYLVKCLIEAEMTDAVNEAYGHFRR